MAEKQSSRDVAPVAPAADAWGDEWLVGSPDRGGYGKQAVAHHDADAIEWAKGRDTGAPPPSGGEVREGFAHYSGS